MGQATGTKSARLLELDGLRGLAALSVVLYHYTYMYNQFFGHRTKPLATFSRGMFGVDLFFIISGFVILMTVSRADNVLDFVVSRLSRIYPVYWVAIAFTFITLTISGL
jgi:peptidoglycan/LPS O-acetylase OafA/YrhL